MAEEKPKNRFALTAMERVKLRTIATGNSHFPDAEVREFLSGILARVDGSEERRLRAEKEKLAQKEAAAAKRLLDLRNALDRVAEKLEGIATARLRAGKFNPASFLEASEYYRATVDHFEKLMVEHSTNENMRDGFPDRWAEMLEGTVAAYFPEVYSDKDDPALEARLEAEREAELNKQRSETAKAIIDAGKKRRGEPIEDDKVVQFDDWWRKK